MILLKDCYCVVTDSKSEYLKGVDILINDGKIEKISKNMGKLPGITREIDASKHVVIPGLVNTHHHFYQTLTRNLPKVQNAKLFSWLVYLYEIWKHLDEDAVYWSTALATAELLKTGCTLTTDHHYLYPAGVTADIMATQFEAASATGIRFSPTRGSMSVSKKDDGLPPDTVVQDEDTIIRDSERVIDEFHDPSDFSMRKIVLAPCSPFSVSVQSMKDTAALARAKGVLLHTHLAETEDENNYCMRLFGKRPLALMEDCDFIGPDVWYAHGIHFTDEELLRLKDTGAMVAHCPSSNMRLGSGICRVKEMRELGINVALAVDGSASNDSSDMLGEVRNALFLQRVTKGADALKLKDVVEMGTESGAALLGFPKCGRIAEGMAADLALFDLSKLEYTGSHSDPLAALVFSGYNHGADYTIVNGVIAVEQNRLTLADENEIIQKAGAAAKRICEKEGVAIW